MCFYSRYVLALARFPLDRIKLVLQVLAIKISDRMKDLTKYFRHYYTNKIMLSLWIVAEFDVRSTNSASV